LGAHSIVRGGLFILVFLQTTRFVFLRSGFPGGFTGIAFFLSLLKKKKGCLFSIFPKAFGSKKVCKFVSFLRGGGPEGEFVFLIFIFFFFMVGWGTPYFLWPFLLTMGWRVGGLVVVGPPGFFGCSRPLFGGQKTKKKEQQIPGGFLPMPAFFLQP